MSKLWTLLFGTLFVLWSAPAYAHRPSDAYLTVTLAKSEIRLAVDVSIRDLDYVLGLDRDANGEVTWGELRESRPAIESYVAPRLSVLQGQRPCTLTVQSFAAARHGEDGYVGVDLAGSCESSLDANPAQLRYSLLFDVDPTHKGLVTVASEGKQRLTVVEQSVPLVMLETAHGSEFFEFFGQGVFHILAGFDHMLFLLALLLPAVLVREGGRWRGAENLSSAFQSVAKIVTAFTVAHSITLALAAAQLVIPPARLIESAVAASVVIAALNNVFPLFGARNEWRLAFVFGLIHGFGFAGVLADGGASGWSFLRSLLGFNLGVESGQLLLVFSFVPLAFLMKETAFYRRVILCGGSLAVGAVAAKWCLERLLA